MNNDLIINKKSNDEISLKQKKRDSNKSLEDYAKFIAQMIEKYQSLLIGKN